MFSLWSTCDASTFSRDALNVRIQVSMFAPTMYPLTSKFILMNLPWKKKNQISHRWKRISCRVACIFKSILSYKSRGVVIFNGLCVAEGLQDGVGLKQLLFQFPLSDKRQQQNPCKLKLRVIVDQGHVHSLIQAGTAKTRMKQAGRAHKKQ